MTENVIPQGYPLFAVVQRHEPMVEAVVGWQHIEHDADPGMYPVLISLTEGTNSGPQAQDPDDPREVHYFTTEAKAWKFINDVGSAR